MSVYFLELPDLRTPAMGSLLTGPRGGPSSFGPVRHGSSRCFRRYRIPTCLGSIKHCGTRVLSGETALDLDAVSAELKALAESGSKLSLLGICLSGGEDLRGGGVRQAQSYGVRPRVLGIKPTRYSKSPFWPQGVNVRSDGDASDLKNFSQRKLST